MGALNDLFFSHPAASGRDDRLRFLRFGRCIFELPKSSLSAFFGVAIVSQEGACLGAVIEKTAVFAKGILVGQCERCWEMWAVVSKVPVLGTYATYSTIFILGEFTDVVSIARVADSGIAQILDGA